MGRAAAPILRRGPGPSSSRVRRPHPWAQCGELPPNAVNTSTLPSPDAPGQETRTVLLVVTVTTLIQALASMAALSVPVLGPRLSAAFGLPSAAVGYYISLVYVAATLSSMLGGEIAQRHGPVRVSQACLALSAAGLVLIACGNLPAALAGALLIGLGYGPVTPASSQWLSMSTPSKSMGLIFSIKQTGVPLGGAVAGLAVPLLATSFNWHVALVCAALACLAGAIMVQPLRARYDSQRDPVHRIDMTGVVQLWSLLCSRSPLYTLAFASFWLSTFQLSLTTYLVTYLHESFGYTLMAAGATMSAAQVAGVVGRVAWGAIADRWIGSVTMLIVVALGMVLGGAALAALSVPDGSWIPMAVVVVVSAFSLGWNGTFLAEVARQAPPGAAGRATGAILACTFAGVVVGPPVFGAIASWADSYRLAFALVGLGPAIAGTLLVLRRRSFLTNPS